MEQGEENKKLIGYRKLLAWQSRKTAPFLILIPCLWFLVSAVASAAQLYFKPETFTLGVGDTARVEVFLDSPENVNALEGVIKFPAETLEVKDVNDGNSIVSFWITRPKIEQGEISFAGAIPGGYPAFNGKLFSIEFLAKKTGRVTIGIRSAQALLNDGKGTPAQLSLKTLVVNVSSKPTGAIVTEIQDTTPPESFKPIIAKDPNLFDGKYFVSFSTQDKGSGIDYYEVAEGRGFFQPNPENWQRGDTPQVLKDQELRSWIFVKAVDKKGNAFVAKLPPPNVPAYQRLLTIIIGVVVIVLILMLWRRLGKRL